MASDILSNGDGATRLSIQQLLSRDRERNALPDMTVQRRQAAPDVGILSRTLIPSSMTKWIIPARLRPGENMQLLFVGENCVHIKEVVPDVRVDFRLRHRQTLPFPTNHIRAVALVGQRTTAPSSQEDTKLPSVYDTMANIKTEQDERLREYPVQVLVLALESGHLQLLTPDFDSQDQQTYLPFKSRRIALPTPEPRTLAPGARIAVDPFSRAFAVSAAFDSIVVYNTRSSMYLTTLLNADPRNWNPIDKEQILSVPGCIVSVEFLNATSFGQEVVMIVLTAVGRRNMLFCYTWDPANFDIRLVFQYMVRPSSTGGSLCNLMIPMARSPNFLLIHGDTVNVYTDILGGNPTMYNITNKQSNWDAEPTLPASSKRRPQFTAWSRVARVSGHQEEYVNFVREDGIVRHYSRHAKTSAVPWGEIANSGHLDCHVDTAFAVFSPVSNGPDYVIAAGDMSCGELHSVGENYLRREPANEKMLAMEFVKQTSFHDWAPMMDMQITQAGDRAALTVISGRQPFGAVSEMRSGFEAQITAMVDLSQLDESLLGANAMWTLTDKVTGNVHCICSYPDQSIAVQVTRAGDVEPSSLQLDTEHETLYAGVCGPIPHSREASQSSRPVAIIVNTSTITLQHLDDEMEAVVSIPCPQPVIGATHCGDSLITAARTDVQQTALQLWRLHADTIKVEPVGVPMIVHGELTALNAYASDNDTLVIAATRSEFIFVFSVVSNLHAGLHLLDKHALKGAIVHSIAMLPNLDGSNLLVCGTRDGCLSTLSTLSRSSTPVNAFSAMDLDDSDDFFSEDEATSVNIGHGPVHVVKDPNLSRIFVLCDHETLLAEVRSGHNVLQITRLILTDESDASFRSSPLTAIAALPPLSPAARNGPGSQRDGSDARLICLDGRNLMLAAMLHEQQTLPCRLPLKKLHPSIEPELPPHDLSGTPTKFLYSSTLDAAIVAGVRYELRPSNKVPEPAWQGKRVSRGFVMIMPVRANAGIASHDANWNAKATHIDLAPSERVLSITEWLFERVSGGSKHPYIIVGTSITKGNFKMIDGKRRQVRTGRLWFFIPSRSKNDGMVTLELKYIKNFEQPVRALAVLDGSRLVVAPHGELRVYSFNSENLFVQICKTELASPATHISTTTSGMILVTTSQHSVCVYRLELSSTDDTSRPALEQVVTDSMARAGIAHIALELDRTKQQRSLRRDPSSTLSHTQEGDDRNNVNLLLGADKKGQIFGLHIPRMRKNQNAAPITFELHLPQCITKFSRGAVRAPWNERAGGRAGVIADDVFGAASDGSIFHFSILNNEARLLLKFLENLVTWNQAQDNRSEISLDRRFMRGDNVDEIMRDHDLEGEDTYWPEFDIVIDPEHTPGEASTHHRRDRYGINGDLLTPLLGNDGSRLLQTMLNRNQLCASAEEERRMRHFGNDLDRRWVKFIRYTQSLGLVAEDVEITSRDPKIADACSRWLDDVMRPVL